MLSSHTTKNVLLLLVIISLPALRLIDDSFPQRLMGLFQKFNQAYPQEKVYVHTDRPYYAAGDTIWLKGYLTDGQLHHADSASRVLYVDLVDAIRKKVVGRKLFRATDGYAPGDFPLPDSLAAGAYVLRAYTGWMRNFDDEFFFQKPLVVYRSDADVPTAASADMRPDVQVFPEGGQLVGGLESRVAFKVVSPLGRGIDITGGYVLSSDRDTVAGFSSQHLGMGFFSLTPETGKQYTVYVPLPDGQRLSCPLPAPLPQGYVMMVDNVSNKDNIRVYIRNNKPAGITGKFTLLAQCRGEVLHMVQGTVDKKNQFVAVPRANLPEGIVHLTLFDEAERPVCERLVFSDQNDRLSVRLTPSKPRFAPREKIEIDVAVTDKTGKPASAEFSVSAVDAGQVIEKDTYAADITSYLLLTSDLKGTIEQPGYYFDPKINNRKNHLDLLLMTQGWRRFTWPDIFADKAASLRYPVEQGITVMGQVIRPNQKATGPVKLTFMVITPDSTRNFLMGESDENGRFGINDFDIPDSTTLLIQAVSGKGNRNMNIKLDEWFSQSVRITRIPFNPIVFQRDELAEYLRRTREYQSIMQQIRRNREILLKEVTVRKKREQPRDSRKIYSQADATIKLDALNSSGAMTVLDVLRGRVAGVQVLGNGFDARVQIRGAANFQGIVEPLYVIDGMPVSRETIMSMTVQDVEAIDVLKGTSAAIYGSQAAGGVISILTKRGSPNYDYSNEKSPGTLVAKLRGYSAVREFYAPHYDVSKPEHIRPDYRATLHWAPRVRTDSTGRARLTFFASDARTTLRLVAEGITTDGRPGVGRAIVEVK